MENDFINKLTEIIEDNISDEQFGVSELAGRIGMSRSNLLRRIKKVSGLSASQFIREVRLKRAMELLKDGSFNVSEVSYKVGFGSTSYFIKCFREHYGYPPGAASDKAEIKESLEIEQADKVSKSNTPIIIIAVFFVIALISVVYVFKNHFSTGDAAFEKSIAVLPFINDSQDSANVYIINGLMESVLNNLQHIKDLRVISRTSVEKYRGLDKSIPEISKELNVRYFVEGSGQKIDDQIMLNIQLIEADSDNHLWAGQFQREAKDIFKLQQEVAKTIAEQIQVFISPEEEARIDKIPTDNLEAYDYFLKGIDLMYTTDPANLHEAISLYKKAIDLDNSFARAYAGVAIAYYFLDAPQIEKQYSEEINNYADQALLFDPQLPQSLIAKALFYMNSMEYDLAVPYLEKALEYNPNSALVVNTLSDFYARYSPDTEKYLEYALKGIRLDIASHDSTTASFIYLHVSNAFIQSGFISEAEEYIKRSVAYDPDNLYSAYVRAYILYARNGDLRQLKDLLSETWMRDPSRLDVLQEVGKACYYMRDYEEAYHYYQKFVDAREAYSLDIYMAENAKIALVYSKMGLEEKSDSLLQDYKAYADNDHSIYKHLSLSMYYSVKGDVDQAIEHLRLFAKEDNYFYWTILFLEIDPLIDNIKDEPEFKMLMQELEAKFWDYHEDIRYSLEEKGLI